VKVRPSYDVIVVGSGPAGAAAARTLAIHGYSVLILEKKKLPRYKMCSGMIGQRSQDLIEMHFGSIPETVLCTPPHLKGSRFCIKRDSFVDAPMEKPYYFNVWRSKFDNWLVSQSGAEVLDGHELIGFKQAGKAIHATVRTFDKEKIQIEASYLIGADGANSRMRKLLSPAFNKKIKWFIHEQLYCAGKINLEHEYFYGFLNPSFSAFYAWLNFKDEYLVYGVSTTRGESIEPYLRRFTEYLEKNFQLEVERIVRKNGCLGVDMGIRGNFILGRNRALLVGEAAGFMNRFGEGISSALSTGHIAAEAIDQANKSGKDAFSIYSALAGPEEEMTINSWKEAKAIAGRDF